MDGKRLFTNVGEAKLTRNSDARIHSDFATDRPPFRISYYPLGCHMSTDGNFPETLFHADFRLGEHRRRNFQDNFAAFVAGFAGNAPAVPNEPRNFIVSPTGAVLEGALCEPASDYSRRPPREVPWLLHDS